MGLIELNEAILNEFCLEIKILGALKHPNILSLIGVAINELETDKIYLVAELMHNGTLQEVLLKKRDNIDWKLKIKFSLDIAKGLEYLHSHNPKIIHRDLKPANCLVDKNWTVKISDFGLSTIKSKVEYTMTSVGTPIYMAPEVILKK